MLNLTANDIIKKQLAAQTIKNTWDSEYRDIFEYTMPARDGYQKPNAEKGGTATDPSFQDRRDLIFSSVGENAADEFVNTMQELLCPPYASWIDLEAGSAFEEDQRPKVNLELDKLSTLANEYKNNSSYDIAFSEFCYDLVAGTACLLVLPGDLRQPLVFKAIPLRDFCIEEGKNAEVRAVYRVYSMKKELVKHQWRELKGKKITIGGKNAKEDIDLIECTYKDYDTNTFHYYVIDKAAAKELVHREYKTNPFIVLRWNKCAGEPYGRGPGMKALSDIRTLNLVMNYSLRAFAYNTPPLLVQEDAMIDVDEFELTPFSLNVVPDTKSSIVPLQLNTDHNIESYKINELTMNIKQAMYGNTIPNEGQARTATEISQRIQQLKRNLNSVFGRLIGEYQIPLVRRIFNILVDFKYIKEQFDVTKIDGFLYKVKINTPLAKQLKLTEAQSMVLATNMLMQFDPTGEMLSSTVKVNEMAAYLLDIMGVPSKFINTPQQAQLIQQQLAQQKTQAQQNAVQTDVDAANAKEMGKADARIAESEQTS